LNLLVLGPQGAGKGTQAKRIAVDYAIPHISTGDMFRAAIAAQTELGKQVEPLLAAGTLVPDEITVALIRERLGHEDARRGFLLDGFPRNAAQAEFFLENFDIDAVIAIELPEEAAIARMQSRRLCSSCGLDYNLIQLRPKVPDVCDNCGGRLVTRADDTPEAIRARLRDYREKTQPILDLLREKELIVTVDGTPGPDVVQAEMRLKLGLVPGAVESLAAREPVEVA